MNEWQEEMQWQEEMHNITGIRTSSCRPITGLQAYHWNKNIIDRTSSYRSP
jgi:hypothetical protein